MAARAKIGDFWFFYSLNTHSKSGFATRHISTAYFETAARSTVIYGYHCKFKCKISHIQSATVEGLRPLWLLTTVTYLAWLSVAIKVERTPVPENWKANKENKERK